MRVTTMETNYLRYMPIIEMIKTNIEDLKWFDCLGSHQTAWEGHIIYIYNQIPKWKPKVVVELGVYLGHSLATMAESCLDHNLDTKLYGIDHFEGDEHAGSFGTTIEQTARECLSQYPNVVLIKNSFNLRSLVTLSHS